MATGSRVRGDAAYVAVLRAVTWVGWVERVATGTRPKMSVNQIRRALAKGCGTAGSVCPWSNDVLALRMDLLVEDGLLNQFSNGDVAAPGAMEFIEAKKAREKAEKERRQAELIALAERLPLGVELSVYTNNVFSVQLSYDAMAVLLKLANRGNDAMMESARRAGGGDASD